MNTTIIVALLATLTAIVTAIITNFMSKNSMLKFEERKLKEQYYLEFIHALSENMNSGYNDFWSIPFGITYIRFFVL